VEVRNHLNKRACPAQEILVGAKLKSLMSKNILNKRTMKRPCRNASQTSIIKMRELHPIPLKTFNFNWMKNLIKIFVFVLVLAMSSESFAQIFRAKAGLNLSTMLYKDDDGVYSDELKMKHGFLLGATAEFPIDEMFSFETGLLISTKGFKYDEDYVQKLNLTYLNVPLTGKAWFDVGGTKLYGLFGPYVGVGVGGKWKSEDNGNGEMGTDEDKVEWGSDAEESDFKRFDFGLTIGAGVEISAIQIGLSYDLGLANISPDTENGNKVHTRALALSVGYKFGGK
jgi:hypothetical protein